MHNGLSSLFSDDGTNSRAKVIGIYILLIGANVAAWLWALIAFHNYPILLGTATLAYTFGLRHAFDADHIAAIDNVTRKLMQEGKRPVAVGFFFPSAIQRSSSRFLSQSQSPLRPFSRSLTTSQASAALSAPWSRPRFCSRSPSQISLSSDQSIGRSKS